MNEHAVILPFEVAKSVHYGASRADSHVFVAKRIPMRMTKQKVCTVSSIFEYSTELAAQMCGESVTQSKLAAPHFSLSLEIAKFSTNLTIECRTVRSLIRANAFTNRI